MNNKKEILDFIGELVDMYRESKEISICEFSSDTTAEIEELEFECNDLMNQACRLVA